MSLNLLVWFYAFTHPFNVFSFVTNFNYILATWCRKPWYFKIINLVWSKIFEISNVYNISCFKDIEIRNSKFVPSNQLLFRIIIQINFTFIRNKKNCIWTALGHKIPLVYHSSIIWYLELGNIWKRIDFLIYI